MCEDEDQSNQLQIWNPHTGICDYMIGSSCPIVLFTTTQKENIFIVQKNCIKSWNGKNNIGAGALRYIKKK